MSFIRVTPRATSHLSPLPPVEQWWEIWICSAVTALADTASFLKKLCVMEDWYWWKVQFRNLELGDFPRSSNEELGRASLTHLPRQGLPVASPIGELRPCGQKTKTQNRSNIVTNSIKTLKMVHIKTKWNKAKLKVQRPMCSFHSWKIRETRGK